MTIPVHSPASALQTGRRGKVPSTDRSAATPQATYGLASINPVALSLLNTKLPSDQFLIIDPNTGQIINPGDFGRIISTSNNPRIIQFAVKLNF